MSRGIEGVPAKAPPVQRNVSHDPDSPAIADARIRINNLFDGIYKRIAK